MKLKQTYRTIKANSQLTDSPRERLKGLLLSMLADKTLPNIVLGALITASIQYKVGLVPLEFVIATIVAWILTIGIYIIGDEVVTALKAASEEMEMDDQTERNYQ